MNISGVILAAGMSSRLGQPKQLLDLGGEPLLRHVVRSALSSTLNEVVLVLGAKAAEIDEAVGYLGQRIVVNPEYNHGQSGSMQLGVVSIAPSAEAVLFLLGDQPSVTPPTVDSIISMFAQSGAPIVQARYQNGTGNPVLIARTLFPELMLVKGDEGARSVISRHRGDVAFAEFPGVFVPQDVDTMDDYEALLADWRAR